MRIQHNIMAMNAYRNYNRNTSALSKNLERLSSGYKINRAGDDAAGLAISEKMRAQITGLDAAQKNVKDGTSLVNTAEGAMQEIQDMLNRMVYLATQSSNGTYDNDVDRKNLQQEVDQLRSEINRIADSANFNGIKLLDGSLDTSKVGELTNMTASGDAAQLPANGTLLGTDTVLHNKATDPKMAEFGINLHNVKYSNDDATGKVTIEFGADKIELVGGASKATLESAPVTAVDPKLTVAGVSYNVTGNTVEEQLKSWAEQFNAETDFATVAAAQNFTAEVSQGGDSIVFTAKQAGNVTAAGLGTATVTGADATTTPTANAAAAAMSGGLATATDIDWTDGTNAIGSAGVDKLLELGSITATFGDGKAFTVSLTAGTAGTGQVKIDATMTYDDVADAIQTAMTALTTAENTAATAANTAQTTTGAGRNTAYTTTLTFGDSTAITGSAADTYSTVNVDTAATVSEYTSTQVTAPAGQMTINNKSYVVKADQTDLAGQLKEWANAYNSDADNTGWTAAVNARGDGITFTAKEAGSMADDALVAAGGTLTDGADSPFDTNGEMSAADIVNAIVNGQGKAEITLNGAVINDIKNVTLSDGATYEISGNGYTLSFTQVADDNGTADLDRTVSLLDKNGTKLESGKTADGIKGDYNVSTSFNKPDTEASIDRIASTYYELTGDMVKDGGSLFIGGKDYTFTTDKAAADEKDSGKVYIGDLLDAKGRFDASAANLEKVAERVTVAAKDNKVWSVSYDKTRLTFTEQLDDEGVAYTQQDGAEYDFTKMEDVEKSLGFRAPAQSGSALTLQIGDTSDSFNQLQVSVGDMHTKALGIDDINIGTPEGASAAINVIKDAINHVSSVRGTLGAISNRLDHTANNLSVMAENIQDAESAIRDTDIAEEMMSYTKNNILVQSAQAMLAQANQVPQGVLQLLQ